MIKEAYCSFEVARLLKEKGFNEECNSYFISDNEIALISNRRDFNNHGIYLSAPTHQMAMAWLREVHRWIIIPQPLSFNLAKNYLCENWGYSIYADDNLEIEAEYGSPALPSYEQACENAIEYCLKNI